MEEIIRVSENRIPVVIGPNGSTKREIQRRTKTKLTIDSSLCEVTISADQSYFEVHVAKNIVAAIGRGFSPENAFKLLNEDFVIEIISIDDFVKHTKQRHLQIKGRVIGREGRIKQIIEKRFNCVLSIYGKTVSIIGDEANIKDAKTVVEKILAGAKHSTVIKSIKRSGMLEDYNEVHVESKIDDIDFDEV